jgi:hypothetical protein
MRAKLNLAVLLLLLVSALALYVFAQAQPDKPQEEMRKALHRTMLVDKQVITLLQVETQSSESEPGSTSSRFEPLGEFYNAIMRVNGKVADVHIPCSSSNKPTAFRNATLRIEMMDRSVQEIPLISVKVVSIEHGENLR